MTHQSDQARAAAAANIRLDVVDTLVAAMLAGGDVVAKLTDANSNEVYSAGITLVLRMVNIAADSGADLGGMRRGIVEVLKHIDGEMWLRNTLPRGGMN